MKLKDIITTVGDKLYWIKFDWKWTIAEDGSIVPKSEVDVTLESEVELHYQWFWHCNPKIDTKEIYKAIEQHDYKTFVKWYDKLENEPMMYFPMEALIYIGDECVGSVVVVFKEEMFELITSQDYECG